MQKPQNIIAQITKNLKNKAWKCIIDGCDQTAINSHLIQQNGLLSNITYNGHLVELKMLDANKWDDRNLPFEFKTVGIKQALSYKVFCNNHDTEIFKTIEKDDASLDTYEAFLLFSYRAVCSEIRKKEINIEHFTRVLNANSLTAVIDPENLNLIIEGNKLGIIDLIVLKEQLEAEIKNKTDKYKYFVYKYPILEIYASAVFNANELDFFSHISEPDLENIYIHFLPLEEEFLILVGYNSDQVSEKTINYCNSWENLSLESLQKKLTNLFVNNIENWGLSTELFKSISDKNKSRYIQTLMEKGSLYGISKDLNFNLFKSNLP
jgi:hypothetical protein